jgi:hypothetical protein
MCSWLSRCEVWRWSCDVVGWLRAGGGVVSVWWFVRVCLSVLGLAGWLLLVGRCEGLVLVWPGLQVGLSLVCSAGLGLLVWLSRWVRLLAVLVCLVSFVGFGTGVWSLLFAGRLCGIVGWDAGSWVCGW